MTFGQVRESVESLVYGRRAHFPLSMARVFVSPEAFKVLLPYMPFRPDWWFRLRSSLEEDDRLSGLEMRLEWKP